jgi:hypothetical protein
MKLLTGIPVRVRRDFTDDRRRFRDGGAHKAVAVRRHNKCNHHHREALQDQADDSTLYAPSIHYLATAL